MEVNERIKELRIENKLYQKDIADFLKVKTATVSAWEKGINEPDIATLKKLAAYFEVSIDYLIGFTDI